MSKGLTTTEFKGLCDNMHTAKKLASKSEKEYKDLKKEVIEYLINHELDSFSAGTCKVSLVNNENVAVPKELADKKLLFDFIKKEFGSDALMNKITINSRSFNSFYKECAADSGELDFSMPGVGKPYDTWTIQVRKK